MQIFSKEGRNNTASLGRFKDLTRNCPVHSLKDNEFLDTFYNGLTNTSKSYIDSIAGNIFRNMTIIDAKEFLDKMIENHDNWTLIEEEETRTYIERYSYST
jgi:hypothetical protein